jgi:hypothetical protein
VTSIIIDANVGHEFGKKTPQAKMIGRWLVSKGRVATGGKNLKELVLTPARELLLQLERAGRVIKISEDALTKKETEIGAELIRSDDPHILALAVISRCRLLFSNDQALIRDFKNTTLVPPPKGRVYRDARVHAALLN